MKKTILIFICLVLSCIVLCSCNKKEEQTSPKANICYTIDASLSDKTITATQEVEFTNVYADILTEAVFHLYPNCYREDAQNKAYYGGLPAYGNIEISEVTVNGETILLDGTDGAEYLSVPTSLSRNERVKIGFIYTVNLPISRLRCGYNDGVYCITSFYPQLSCYGENGFLKDSFSLVGDPFYAEASTYNVNFSCTSNLVVACSCPSESSKISEEISTYTFRQSNIRDFGIVASADFYVVTQKVNDTDIYVFDREGENNELLAVASSAYTAFSENFGSNDLTSFSVCVIPFDYSGMEFSGLCLVASSSYAEQVDTTLHETAHQWWYQLVGTDPIRESYLDEGLASFCSVYYYELVGDSKTFKAKMSDIKKAYTQYETLQARRKAGTKLNLDSTVYEYTSYQYTMLMYYKACMMFNNLYELYGKEKFNECLCSYAKTYAHQNCDMDDFILVADKTFRTEVKGLLYGWISENAVATTFSQQ